MSKEDSWLLVVFMALGAKLNVPILDPPSVGGTYKTSTIEFPTSVIIMHY